MKRLVWAVLFLMLILTGCVRSEEKNPYRLKSQSVTSCNRMEDAYSEPWIWENFYDEQGLLSAKKDNLGNASSMTYDDYGNLIRIVLDNADGSQRIVEYVLSLDAQHRIIHREAYQDGVLYNVRQLDYDRTGNVVRQDDSRVSDDGMSLDSQMEMEYDRYGNLIHEKIRWSDGDGSDKILTYENGRLSRCNIYDPDGNQKEYWECTWEQETKTQTCHRYDAQGNLLRIGVSVFDEYGNLLEEKAYYPEDARDGEVDDKVDRIETFTYERIPES